MYKYKVSLKSTSAPLGWLVLNYDDGYVYWTESEEKASVFTKVADGEYAYITIKDHGWMGWSGEQLCFWGDSISASYWYMVGDELLTNDDYNYALCVKVYPPPSWS